MSIFTKAKQLFDLGLQTVKNKVYDVATATVAPSKEVATQRRVETFGSESKGKAAAIIIGTSAVAAVAPYVPAAAYAAAARTAGNVAVQATKSAVASPQAAVKTVAGSLAATALVGAVVAKPSIVPNAYKTAYQAGSAAVDTFEEHPILSTAALAIGGATAVKAYNAVDNLLSSDDAKEIKKDIQNVLPSSISTSAPTDMAVVPSSSGSITPITAQTQQLTKSSTVRKRKRTIKKNKQLMEQNRPVRIYNAIKNENIIYR